jgi:hypothetical protein
VPRPWPDWSRGDSPGYRLRPPRPYLPRFRDAERRALFRPADLRPLDDLRALFRAERRPPFLPALALLADLRPPFLALFLLDRLADLLAVFLRGLLRGLLGLALFGDNSSESLYDDGVEAGVGEGVLSMGSGSIHPEPDQPISI